MSSDSGEVKPKWLERSGEWYIKSKTVRALMQIAGAVTFGGSSALDTAIALKVENMRAARLRTFFEELDKDGTVLTNEVIQTEDFLHAFFATTKAALNTKRKEKIEMFARLLKSFADSKNNLNIDEYEDNISILDELSCRELLVLNILEKFEVENPQTEGNTVLQRSSVFWKDFVNEVSTKLNISEDEVAAILTRLNRTGCYCEITGGYFDYGGGKGYLTPLYFKLKVLISEQIEITNSKDHR